MSSFDFDGMLANIKQNKVFSFSRWGDGEWNCIFGTPGENCDGHEYFASLSLALRNVLCRNPQYILGMQRKAMIDMGDKIRKWLEQHRLSRDWVDADMLHDASLDGRLQEFNGVLKGRDVVIVANKNYDSGPYDLVPVPEKNAWLAYKSTKIMLKNRINRRTVVLYCAGMMSKVLIDDMHRTLMHPVTQIDVGSAFDPYLGIQSRKYHKKIIERERLCE